MKKIPIVFLAVLCLAAGSPAAVAADEKPVVIGLALDDVSTETWSTMYRALLDEVAVAGARSLVEFANYDAELQNEQIKSLVDRGAIAIIVVAVDGCAAAWGVEYAADHGVPVVAFDRLILSPRTAAYLSFDFTDCGRLEAERVLAIAGKGRFVILGGSPIDPAAHRIRAGHMEVLQPLLDAGDVEIVADEWVENWSTEKAEAIMEGILKAAGNRIDAVVAPNDSTALGAIRALENAGLAGKIPVSGMDATAPACNAVAKGLLTMTVFKDLRLLPPAAVDLALRLARGDPVEELRLHPLASFMGNTSPAGSVPCLFLPLTSVDRDNLYEVIVTQGVRSYDQVYRGVPEDRRPPRP